MIDQNADPKARDLFNALRAATGEFGKFVWDEREACEPGFSESVQRRITAGASLQTVVLVDEVRIELVHGPETQVLCRCKGLEFWEH